MGLPGAGKTWLAERLQKHLPDCAWFNADQVRHMANDWDFSEDARMRQAHRMRSIADYESGCGRTVICDFVCPTDSTRSAFNADVVVWVDTITKGRYDDTNKMFEEPKAVDFRVMRHLKEEDGEVENIARAILSQKIYDDGILTGC